MKTLDEIILGRPTEAPKEGEDALNEIVRAGRIMQDLLSSEAWPLLEQYLMKRQAAHVQELMQPIRGQDQVFIQESNKGAIHALAFAVGLPSVIIAQSKEILEARSAGKDKKHVPLAP